MSKIRYAILCSLLFLPVFAPVAWSQREARTTQTPQVKINLIIGTLNLTAEEKNHLLQIMKPHAETGKKDKPGKHGTIIGMTDNPEKVNQLIQRLRDRGVAKLMACPTLVTLDGRPASFLSGGQIPIFEASDSMGEKGWEVKIKKVGTDCTFLPTITDKGRIKLKMEFTHHEPELKVPSSSFSSMKHKTDVEVENGQSLFLLAPKFVGGESKESDTRREYLFYTVTTEIVSQ